MDNTMDNKEVSRILEEIGTLLELKGENPFKFRAYAQAARLVATMSQDIVSLVKSGDLKRLKGIGTALAEKIEELVATGRLPYYEALKASTPAVLFELLQIPGLGPKRVRVVYEQLGVHSLGELEYACHENRLRELPGFGPKMQERILEGIRYRQRHQGLFLYSVAAKEGEAVLAALRTHPGVQRASLAGGLRRRKEVVKDADLVVSTDEPASVVAQFCSLDQAAEVLARGETKSVIRLASGLQVDLRLVTDPEFPYALHHSTGSKDHHVALRGRARRMGLTVNEYGLFRGETLVPCEDEAAIYGALGLDYIPPELREGLGEVEAAETHVLPTLVEFEDIRGVFHTHTTASDGTATLEEMVQAATVLGYEYIGISDHSRSAKYAGGLEIDRLQAQRREIEALQGRYPQIRIFKGTEVDILPDGSLDYPDEVLAELDFVIASVHSRFTMAEDEMTRRVLRAIRNPHVTMLGHSTGRLLLSREAYPINLPAVLEEAARLGVVIELNANPYRLDLDWRLCRSAKALGVKVSINPDAHSMAGLQNVQYGVGIARKGWLSAADVLNTLPADQMATTLHALRAT